jgi:two-component system sensor histidine kinase KdpD
MYLCGVVVVASRCGRVPGAVASIVAVLLFNVLFTEPYYSLNVYNPKYLVTFAVMLLAGLVSSALTARVRYQADVSRRSQRRTEALYRLSRRLTAISGERRLIDEAERTVGEVFDVHAVIYMPNAERRIRPIFGHSGSFAASAAEFAAAQWVLDHRQPAGAGTDTLPSAAALYLPLTTPNGAVGVLAVQSQRSKTRIDSEARSLLETCATQIALALERDQLAAVSRAAQLEVETEKMRSALLSAVSHDLRTPLSAIAGASSALQTASDNLDGDTRAELLGQISEEALRLSRLVENLLHMTRLSGGEIQISRHWQPVDEVIGSAIARLRGQLADRAIEVTIPDNMPLGHFDEVLVEQLLVNLLDNAARYSPPGTPIAIRAEPTPTGVAIEVADRGRGLAAGDEKRIFDMFYRGADAPTDRRGAGLGLAICRTVVRIHQGTIEAANRAGGGTVVRFVLPHAGTPPTISAAGE